MPISCNSSEIYKKLWETINYHRHSGRKKYSKVHLTHLGVENTTATEMTTNLNYCFLQELLLYG